MLEIQNVSKTFNAGTVNEKTALNGLNLKLNEGDFVTVIGGNGAGKSTMLNAVAGVWPVDCGKIIIEGSSCCQRLLVCMGSAAQRVPSVLTQYSVPSAPKQNDCTPVFLVLCPVARSYITKIRSVPILPSTAA